MNTINRAKGWLLPAVLILFLLEIILFPFVVRITYAGRSENPDHVLTYTSNKLTWGSTTGVDPDTGAAELSLYSSSYQNVAGENGEKVVAPGTEGKNIIRLKNDAGNPITYVAVMYHIKEEPDLPVAPVLVTNGSCTDTGTYPLPEGVTQEQVVRAVTGSVSSGQIQDFDITWSWAYDEGEDRDVVDTALGNKAAFATADEVKTGLYIVVEEEVSPVAGDPDDSTADDTDAPGGAAGSGTHYTYPQLPQTGDPGDLTLYFVLLAVSSILFVLLLLERRKEKS